jgi:hypothetical protein
VFIAVGLAVVFHSEWDLAGALKFLYGETEIKANIVTRHLSIDQNGLKVPTGITYPFGAIYVYFGRKETFTLPDPDMARVYLETMSSDRTSTASISFNPAAI